MGYYMTGDFYRMRGDFYRANRRGDFFGDVGSFITGTALPLANKIFGPAGIMTGARIATGQISPFQALGGLLPTSAATSPGTSMMLPPMVKSIASRILPAAGTLVTRGLAGSAGAIKAAAKKLMLPEPGYGGRRRYRRMNVCNPRALRRALRRAKGFESFAKEVVHITNRKKVVSGFRMPRRRKRRA